MLARRCALSLLLALPAAAEDAMWSGAAPSAAFTGGSSAADTTHTDASSHASDGGAPPLMRSAGVTKAEAQKRVLLKPATASTRSAASPSSATSPDAIYEMAHPPESTESRLNSGWELVLVVSAVAAFGALAAYGMGFFTRDQRVAKKKRAIVLAENEEEQRQDPALLPSHVVMATPENMVATMAAPLSIYQLPAAPAPAPMSYAAAPVMMMSSAPAYATAPAPAYSAAYAMAPAATVPAALAPATMQPAAMMPFEAAGAGAPPPEPLPVPREPLPVA